MKKINFLSIADTNCWIAYLMPLSKEDRSYEKVSEIQEYCMRHKIFGMGWAADIDLFNSETALTSENLATYKSVRSDVSKYALNAYEKMQKGDYVIARNKDGHFYVGKISSNGAFWLHDKNDKCLRYFSWGCRVEQWKECRTEREVPSEIVGRFSQRLHSTVQRVSTYRLRLLIIAMYENYIPKLAINESNFVRSLDYKELEDLVAVHIADKHRAEGYYLLPSSCKINQQNVEFYFVSGAKKITCQVKNQKDISIERYINESGFEKIYIFCGKWDEEDVRKKREEYRDFSHIEIISPKELFATLKKNQIFENPYYDYNLENRSTDEIEKALKEKGYELKNISKTEAALGYTKDDDYICFVKGDALFYSVEFGMLILSYHILDDVEKEQEYIERILKDLNC